MNEVRPERPSAKWQTDVSTIHCKFIGDHIPLMIKNDWTFQRTGFKKYKEPVSEGKKKIKPDKKTRRQIELCQGPLCSYITGYRDKLMKENQEPLSSQHKSI